MYEENSLEWLADKKIREWRDAQLAGSDFRVLNGVPWDIEPWVTYRQQLRDIPQQAGYPLNVDLPASPQV